MDTLVMEIMQKRLEQEINQALKPLELQVEKIEFLFREKPTMVINLEGKPAKDGLFV